MQGKRVHFIDEMRGFLIIYVVIYHILYDLGMLFDVDMVRAWMLSPITSTLRDILTGSLIVISGISCLFSRSNIRRGIKTLCFALALTVFTVAFMPQNQILFGILHCLGFSMLLYGLLEKLFQRIPTAAGFICFAALAMLTWHLSRGSFGVFNIVDLAPVPEILTGHKLLFPLGLPVYGVFSADYFPIFPWTCLFLTGPFIGRPLKAGAAPAFFYKSRAPELAFLGRHTLIIYMLHQPVVYGVLYLLFEIL